MRDALKRFIRNLMTPGQVAERLGLSRPHIYTLASAGILPSIKFSKAVRFDPADVERFIRDHRRGGGKAA